MVHARFDVASISITHFFAISFCPVFCLWSLFWRLQEPSSSSFWCLQLGGWGWSRGVCPCSLDLGFNCVTVTRACPGCWGAIPHCSVFHTVLSVVSPCSLVGGLEPQICFLAVLLSPMWGWGDWCAPTGREATEHCSSQNAHFGACCESPFMLQQALVWSYYWHCSCPTLSMCHPAYLTHMQTTLWDMLDWMKHKLESRLLGEIPIISDMQIHNV